MYTALRYLLVICLFCYSIPAIAQKSESASDKVQKASKKVRSGYKKENADTLAQGYFDLGDGFYQKGELKKSESYYQKAKDLFEKNNDPDGIAKSSRALAKVQEDQNKDVQALDNYNSAQANSVKTGNITNTALNSNDARRLSFRDSMPVVESLIQSNIKLGLVANDTNEIVTNYSRWADINLKNRKTNKALDAFNNAYHYSKNYPDQAIRFNEQIANVYLQNKDYPKAIETKKELLKEGFVKNSTQFQAQTISSLADIYLLKKEDTTAMRLLNESYALSIRNGHTLVARTIVGKLDSIFQRNGRKDLSLKLYKEFLGELPKIIAKDSSIADNRLIAETELRIRDLETEKALKDSLIRRKNISNYWLTGSVIALALFTIIILYILRKLRIRNKKIALQSLRREMNPHFIFNSLNSINQFIATNNEIEANQYLTKFSTLMRRVMENSKEDFVSFGKEVELLQNYLELEKTRFPEKFDFSIKTDPDLLADEHFSIPGMLIQPHLENSIWHGLRYIGEKGYLNLVFNKIGDEMEILVEDNGIGIEGSKKAKTENQRKHSGRGIANTMERIGILNELYGQKISCHVEDKPLPGRGVKVRLVVPLLKTATT